MQNFPSLTDFERKQLNEQLAKANQSVTIKDPSEVGPKEQAEIDRITQEAVARIKGMQVNIAQPKTLSEISPQKRAEVLRNLSDITSKLPQASAPVAEETIQVPLPSFQFDEPAPVVNVKPEPEVPVVTEAPKSHLCVNCSWDQKQKPSDIKPEDKYEWLRAVLANKPYSKSFALFNGHLHVKFRVRSKADMELIHDQLVREANLGRLPSSPVNLALIAYNDRLRKLGMAASMVSITGYKRDLPQISSEEAKKIYASKEDDFHNVASAADRVIFGDWNESLYSAVFKQFLIFEDMCFKLAEASNSPDFWKEIDEQR